MLMALKYVPPTDTHILISMKEICSACERNCPTWQLLGTRTLNRRII